MLPFLFSLCFSLEETSKHIRQHVPSKFKPQKLSSSTIYRNKFSNLDTLQLTVPSLAQKTDTLTKKSQSSRSMNRLLQNSLYTENSNNIYLDDNSEIPFDCGTTTSTHYNAADVSNTCFNNIKILPGVPSDAVANGRSILSNMSFINCSFVNCYANGNQDNDLTKAGGAIYYKPNSETNSITIDMCSFDSCESLYYGGALFVQTGELKLTNSNFTRNKSGKESFSYGSAIGMINTASSIEYCRFLGNICNEDEGSVIYYKECRGAYCVHNLFNDTKFTYADSKFNTTITVDIDSSVGSSFIFDSLCFPFIADSRGKFYPLYFQNSRNFTITRAPEFRITNCYFSMKMENETYGLDPTIKIDQIIFNYRMNYFGSDQDFCPYHPTQAFSSTVAFTASETFTQSIEENLIGTKSSKAGMIAGITVAVIVVIVVLIIVLFLVLKPNPGNAFRGPREDSFDLDGEDIPQA